MAISPNINSHNNNSTKVKIPKASELIADNLRDKIIKGELKKGASLPPENQLLLDFGISRPTLREALRILESEGLIEIMRGSRTGAKIAELSTQKLASSFSNFLQFQKTNILDLYEARLAIEPYAIQKLCISKDGARIKTLRNIAENLRKLVEQERQKEFPRAMALFHIALVDAAQNQTLSVFNKVLLDLVVAHQHDFQDRFKQSQEVLRKRFSAGYRSSIKLLNLINEGKADEAISHWQLHLKNVAQGWTIRDEYARIIDKY